MYPIPGVPALAGFTGRAEATFTVFASEALAQATFLLQLKTGLTEVPEDPAKALLASYAILQLADSLYLSQPFALINAKPFQSESIGSYSYSKSVALFRESASYAKAGAGQTTGLFWWDYAIREFSLINETETGSISVFERDPALYREDDTGALVFEGPVDKNMYPNVVPFDINSDSPYRGNQ